MAVKKLREQAVFDQFGNQDYTGGYGMNTYDDPGSYNPTGSSFDPSPSQRDPSDYDTSYVKNDIQGLSNKLSQVSNVSTNPSSNSVNDELKQYIDAMNAGYTPDNRSSDRLNNLLDNTPDINDYNPSVMRKITAGLQSIKDPKMGQQTLNQPYLQDFAQWKEKTAPFQAASTGENLRNTQERTLVSNALTGMNTANKNAQSAENIAEKNRITEENNRLRNQVAIVRNNILQAKNHNLEVIKDGDRFIGIDPQTHERFDLGTSEGMSREQEINALGQWNVAAGAARSGAEMARTIAGGAGSVVIDGKIYKPDPNNPNNFIPAEGLPQGTPNKIGTPKAPVSSLEQRRIMQDKMKETFELYPEARDQMVQTPNGYDMIPRPELKPPNIFGRGAVTQKDLDKWDDVREAVDPTYKRPVPNQNSPASSEVIGTGVYPGRTTGPNTGKDINMPISGSGKPNVPAQVPQPTPAPQIPPAPASIPRDAIKKQYNPDTGQWRYMDQSGKWVVVGGGGV